MVCLFLLAASPAASSQDLVFDEPLRQAYDLALNLRCADALEKVGPLNSPEAAYVASLAETIELLVTEDVTKFSMYEERFENRLDKKNDGSPANVRFLQAEIRLQWALVYLKFGHELDAALHFREAYQIAVACREKFPDYLPIRKTTGILRIVIGSVPDKYNWLLDLLNMRGSVPEGLSDLSALSTSGSALAMEAKLIHSMATGFVLSDPSQALVSMHEVLSEQSQNPLALFFGASLALKNSENDLALGMLGDLSQYNRGLPLYYADYLKGEGYLRKGDYLNSISSYRWFISHQAGQNFIKDAWYKMGLCYWLNGSARDAQIHFQEARTKGKEATEADKSAARNLAETDLPNIKLLRVRYLTDGGYYQQAEEILAGVSGEELVRKKDQVEFYYRMARISHKMNRPEAAELYLRTIAMAGRESWYFAPNACLQLGYIYQSQNRLVEAEGYFERALSYRRHEYKNSIDSKARSALSQLRRI